MVEYEQVKWLLDLIFDLVVQCCYDDEKDVLDSCCVTTYAEAIRLLAKYGYVEIVKDVNYRCVEAKIKGERDGCNNKN